VQHRERAFQTAAWTMLAGGSVALLLGPVIAAVTVLAKMQSPLTHELLGSLITFVVSVAVLVPLLFWIERLTRGHWIDEDVEDEATVAPVPVGGVIEVVLWGPRTIVAAMRRRRQHAHAKVLTEAASLIAYLRHFPEDGVGTDELPTLRPEPVLNYLASRDWVGVSADGRRVWLRSDSRRALGFDER
jgi:hypothetical protein